MMDERHFETEAPRGLLWLGLFALLLGSCGGGDDVTPGDPPSELAPCMGIPPSGQCDGSELVLCVAGSGNADPFIFRLPCGEGLICGDGPWGKTCLPSGACAPGESECRGGSVAACVSGQWQVATCPSGCLETALGANCRANLPTVRYRNTLDYEYRAVNATWTDWSSETYRAVAQGFLVLSLADDEVLDAAITDGDGYFELDVVVPAFEDEDDGIVILATRVTDDRSGLAYAVMDPGFGSGERSVRRTIEDGVPTPRVWNWRVSPRTLPSMSELYLPLTAGSAAAYVYDYLRFVHDVAKRFYGERARTSLAVWLGFGTTWDCGACFTRAPMGAATSAAPGAGSTTTATPCPTGARAYRRHTSPTSSMP